MASRHTERGSSAPPVKDMQKKTTVTCHLSPVRTAAAKKVSTTRGRGSRAGGTPCGWRDSHRSRHCGSDEPAPPKAKHRPSTCRSNPSTHTPEGSENGVSRGICTPVPAAVSLTAKYEDALRICPWPKGKEHVASTRACAHTHAHMHTHWNIVQPREQREPCDLGQHGKPSRALC